MTTTGDDEGNVDRSAANSPLPVSGYRRPSVWYVRDSMASVGVFNTLGRRGLYGSTSMIALGSCLLVMAAPSGASARTQSITEDVRLKLVKKSGMSYEHRGTARGTFDGSVRSKMRLDSLSISGVVTIVTRGGSVDLKVRGTARSGGLRSKFDGTATLTGGTGRFRKARGKGKFSGVVNRQTWAATLHATGTLSF